MSDRQYVGYQQITVLTASTALTVPNAAGAIIPANFAIVRPAAQAVRYRADGTAPTAAIGQPVAVGQEVEIYGNLGAFRFIEQAAGANLDVTYYYIP